MLISDAERRRMILGIEEGDVLIADHPCGQGTIYFAVLEKFGFRTTISLPAASCELLIPARGIGGDLEVSEKRELLFADGEPTSMEALIKGVIKGSAKGLVERYRKRIQPNEKLLKNQFEIIMDEQTKSTLLRICALVANKDYRNSATLYEMFFRIIKVSRSSVESAFYLGHFLHLLDELVASEERIEFVKNLNASLGGNPPPDPKIEQEASGFIDKIKK